MVRFFFELAFPGICDRVTLDYVEDHGTADGLDDIILVNWSNADQSQIFEKLSLELEIFFKWRRKINFEKSWFYPMLCASGL